MLVGRAELLAIAECLFVVIPDDLVELAGAACVRFRGPLCEQLVQLRAKLLRDSRVRRIADERMAKPVCIFAPGPCRE